jgi:hypothetical protein
MNVRFLFKKILLSYSFFFVSTLLPDKATDLKEHFNDVLLIINYNHPFYQSIDFLKKIYGIAFDHIVFYGEKPNARVHTINHHFGWYGYRTLADAMERYPDFRGYLYTNDDCFLNFWNLTRFDKNKLWINKSNVTKLEPTAIKASDWPHWSRDYGYKAVKKVYDQLPEKYVTILQHNGGDQAVFTSMADMVYIPNTYREATVEMCNLCSAQPVFLEIGLPTLCACVAPKEQWENFNVLYLWYVSAQKIMDSYTPSLDAIHPLKFSDQNFQKLVIKETLHALAD